MAKTAFNKKKNPFTSKLDLNLRKKLVKCYVGSMALYGAETWTLRATDQKRLESFEMWCWRRMECCCGHHQVGYNSSEKLYRYDITQNNY